MIREITQASMQAIGDELGNRDHSTIVYAIGQVESRMKEDTHFKETVEDIVKNIRGQLNCSRQNPLFGGVFHRPPVLPGFLTYPLIRTVENSAGLHRCFSTGFSRKTPEVLHRFEKFSRCPGPAGGNPQPFPQAPDSAAPSKNRVTMRFFPVFKVSAPPTTPTKYYLPV